MLHLAKGKIQEGKRTFECKSESTVDLVVEKSFVGKIEKGGRGAPRSHAAIISSCFWRPFLWLFRLVVIHKAVKRYIEAIADTVASLDIGCQSHSASMFLIIFHTQLQFRPP